MTDHTQLQNYFCGMCSLSVIPSKLRFALGTEELDVQWARLADASNMDHRMKKSYWSPGRTEECFHSEELRLLFITAE